jgi:hypothetical protein
MKILMLLAHKHAHTCYGLLDECKKIINVKKARTLKVILDSSKISHMVLCGAHCGFDTHATTEIHTIDRDVLRPVKFSCGLFMHS